MAKFKIIKGWAPGVLGRVVELHGDYYNRHWGFGSFFESRVAADMAEFLQRFDDARDGIWVLLSNESVEGSIAIDARHAETKGAHLRWFIVAETLHGTGAGHSLLSAAVEHCRKRRYSVIYLHTFGGLAAARHLYEKFHFRLVEQLTGRQWGTEVEEQKFVLDLT
jgi:GNAT superfamily N-acetyltransferase